MQQRASWKELRSEGLHGFLLGDLIAKIITYLSELEKLISVRFSFSKNYLLRTGFGALSILLTHVHKLWAFWLSYKIG